MTDHTAALRDLAKFRESFVMAVGDKSPFAKEALKLADDAIAALARPQQPAGWRPIETAPKDGPIWVFNGEQGVMHWTEGECYALWVWTDDVLSDVDPSPDQPTHYMPLPAAPGTEPAQGQDAELHAEWMACETRRPWIVNSLRHRAKEMRAAEKRCRNAYRKDFMGKPAAYVADAFAEAAAAFEARLDSMTAAQDAAQGGGKNG